MPAPVQQRLEQRALFFDRHLVGLALLPGFQKEAVERRLDLPAIFVRPRLVWQPLVRPKDRAVSVLEIGQRRDYQRIGDYMATSNGRLAAIESYQRKTVTVDEHRESMSGVHRKIDALFEKNADQIGAQNTRLVIIETKMGAHDFEEEET